MIYDIVPERWEMLLCPGSWCFSLKSWNVSLLNSKLLKSDDGPQLFQMADEVKWTERRSVFFFCYYLDSPNLFKMKPYTFPHMVMPRCWWKIVWWKGGGSKMCPKMENCKKMRFSKKKHSEFFILGNICPRNEVASNKT